VARSRTRRRHSLSIVLGVIFMMFTGYSLVSGYYQYLVEHQGVSDGFWLWWTVEYLTSVLADVFGALVLVLATKHFYEAGSAEGH
jgi:hypothetical protein